MIFIINNVRESTVKCCSCKLADHVISLVTPLSNARSLLNNLYSYYYISKTCSAVQNVDFVGKSTYYFEIVEYFLTVKTYTVLVLGIKQCVRDHSQLIFLRTYRYFSVEYCCLLI